MIAVTIKESSLLHARQVMAALPSGVERVELRVDDLAGQDWPSLIQQADCPIILTCRPSSQGGSFAGTEAERLAVLEKGLQVGADMVDVEVGSFAMSLLERYPANRFLFSLHDFEAGAGRVQHHLERLLSTPRQALLKLAFIPEGLHETLLARQLLDRAGKENRRLVMVPMGEAGIPGRLLAPFWGSAWTYAVPDGSPPVAPGQFSLNEVKDLYDVDGIRTATVLTGILGQPIASSLSPWMHNRAARQAGLDARYLPFPSPNAADLLVHAGDWGLAGLSVTHPHKAAVLPWLDEMSPVVRACRAANTLVFRQDRLVGENT
ncbi:MAG: type I 3-dehydroquinate dehydratase, partial [Acidobacteriota bacterium]